MAYNQQYVMSEQVPQTGQVVQQLHQYATVDQHVGPGHIGM